MAKTESNRLSRATFAPLLTLLRVPAPYLAAVLCHGDTEKK